MRILLFGGTAEGHTLARRLAQAGHQVPCGVSTDSGREVLEPQPNLTVRMGRMDQGAMEAEMGRGYDCVVDATHPYAAQVSGNIRAAAKAVNLPYQRLLRPREEAGDVLWADSPEHAEEILQTMPGKVYLTTGSKQQAVYATHRDSNQRLNFPVALYEHLLSHWTRHGKPRDPDPGSGPPDCGLRPADRREANAGCLP